jgi:phosphotransferase system HPr (HPr) family protein
MPASSEPHRQTGVAERAVVLPKHLHARPAGQVAQAAARHHPTTVELAAGDRNANARSVLAIMALGAVTGNTVRITVAGYQADAVADELVEILLSPDSASRTRP